MQTAKMSVSVPQTLSKFVDHYQKEHHCKSRSEVISIALQLLQKSALEQCYRDANKEIDDAFDNTVADGLDDEAW